MAKPVSPYGIDIKLPDWVIDGINEAILSKWRGKSFSMKQEEIEKVVMKHAPENFTVQQLYDNHYLDFEKLYEGQGWIVKYDKPGYNESGPAVFYFSVKTRD